MTVRSLVGTEAVLDVGPVAHGGHCVARLDGRVVFVRHAIPGERVLVRVTEGDEESRFLRADAVEVKAASPDRVTPPCPYAGPGRCGGCDFQHVTPAHQRQLKAAVVREQFQRLARLDLDELFPGFEVEPLPGRPDGLRWRTRVEFAAGDDGRLGLRQHRSHDVVVLDDCLIADERVIASRVLARSWLCHDGVDVVAADAPARPVFVTLPERGRTPTVRQRVEVPGWSGEFRVSARGFWQVHPSAAPAFVEHVLTILSPRPGEGCLDLYAGVGLFALALADAVGPTGSVLAVEGFRPAVVDGLANAADRPQVEFRHGRVDQVMHGVVRRHGRSDLVVLDPPRTGAGRSVVEDVVATGPRAVAYVACDPAALARDTAYLHEAGYRLTSVRAFDAFPMTHHVECIAGFVPA
ncbi:TRAM domain-containing protein [Lapillicoccus sp.]|uniref:class I SAM-dependent RNA methyltransferase n=1 Tax=Lapillicoccus sp. TaxID=1909287 RepID=UPI0032672BB0